MKTDLHPTYHEDVTVTCACGASHPIGSTLEELKVEICSACHPFYTGNEKVMDTAGRVDKFKKRMEQASAAPVKKKKAAPAPVADEAEEKTEDAPVVEEAKEEVVETPVEEVTEAAADVAPTEETTTEETKEEA